MRSASLAAILLASAAAFATEHATFWPDPILPADNPSSDAGVRLGERLFHDTNLSINNSISCATCHIPEQHFTDGRTTAIGATGEVHSRNTPTLYNVAYHSSLGWSDAGITALETQHLVPLTNHTPLEMGFGKANLTALAENATYPEAFLAAFGAREITLQRVSYALAQYVRTLRPPQSDFDRYVFFDDSSALSVTALAGMDLFFSPRLGCSECHASLNFSGPISHAIQASEPVFHITGVGGSTTEFRAPTLRMIAHTAPYMHNGSIADLSGVIEHYQNTKAPRVPEFVLDAAEKQQLLAFLHAL